MPGRQLPEIPEDAPDPVFNPAGEGSHATPFDPQIPVFMISSMAMLNAPPKPAPETVNKTLTPSPTRNPRATMLSAIQTP